MATATNNAYDIHGLINAAPIARTLRTVEIPPLISVVEKILGSTSGLALLIVCCKITYENPHIAPTIP